jgi:hypothetical protein
LKNLSKFRGRTVRLKKDKVSTILFFTFLVEKFLADRRKRRDDEDRYEEDEEIIEELGGVLAQHREVWDRTDPMTKFQEKEFFVLFR